MESEKKHEEESIIESQARAKESQLATKQGPSQQQEIRLPGGPSETGMEAPAANAAASSSFADTKSFVSSSDGYSDDALALMFAANHANDLRYTAGLGRWNIFDGTRWALDEKLEVLNRSRELCRAASVPFGDKPRVVNRMRSAGTIRAVENLARCDPRFAATLEQWDADPLLLNTPDGVVDLRTGLLRPARREDYMTRITAVGPGGDCPTWLRFLSQITDDDEELQQYLQTVSGYALTGLTTEQCLFFLYGTGGNGKSVFTGTIESIMNTYGRHAPIESFVASNHQQHPTDLASLVGARWCSQLKLKRASGSQNLVSSQSLEARKLLHATCGKISLSSRRPSSCSSPATISRHSEMSTNRFADGFGWSPLRLRFRQLSAICSFATG